MTTLQWTALFMFFVDLAVLVISARLMARYWFQRETERGVVLLLLWTAMFLWAMVSLFSV